MKSFLRVLGVTLRILGWIVAVTPLLYAGIMGGEHWIAAVGVIFSVPAGLLLWGAGTIAYHFATKTGVLALGQAQSDSPQQRFYLKLGKCLQWVGLLIGFSPILVAFVSPFLGREAEGSGMYLILSIPLGIVMYGFGKLCIDYAKTGKVRVI